MPKFIPAVFDADAFNCPYCKVYAHQTWLWVGFAPPTTGNSGVNSRGVDEGEYVSEGQYRLVGVALDGLNLSRCGRCARLALWLGTRLLLPPNSNAEPAHDDMPLSVLSIYSEAAEIADASPRGAAALLRVALELLTHELGCDPRKGINDKIGELVGQGLSPEVIKALDILRVTGNNAAHTAGTLLLDDDRESATALFQIINYIVEQTISHKKRLEEMHARPPDGIKQQIERRNQKALPTPE